MKKPVLIIFIDAFPYKFLERTKYMKKFPIRFKVRPSLGYSINIKAEIFGGYAPDNLGWFCKWNYDSESKLKMFTPFFLVLDIFRKINLINRGLHKFIGKIFGDIGNIPFRYLPFISKNSVDIFSLSFPKDSLLKSKYLKVIASERFKSSNLLEKDFEVFKQGLKYIKKNSNSSILLTFVALDHIGHWKGPYSGEYHSYVLTIDKYVEELKTYFLKINKNANVIVLSDHGMSEVEKGVRLDLEKYFGKPSEKKYFYIMDGTILRIWCFDFEICEKIKKFLNNLNLGKVLNREERAKYGITKKKFGDIIFLIKERYMFCPSFWGSKLSKGMHGYHPDFENQKGIFLFSGDDNMEVFSNELTPRNIYFFLRRLLINNEN